MKRQGDAGMTSVVLVWGAVMVMLGVFLVCLEAGAATYGWLRAEAALDAYASAQDEGLDTEQSEEAALASLSPALRGTARIEERDGRLELSVRPRSLTGLPVPRVTATSGPGVVDTPPASPAPAPQGGTP